MKRTPPLLALLAVAVQLAGIGLCVWVMSWHAAAIEDDEPAPDPAPRPRSETPPAPPPPGPPPVVTPWAAPVMRAATPPEAEPAAAPPGLPPRMTAIPLDIAPVPPAPPAPAHNSHDGGPKLVAPPPVRGETPGYILEIAERTTQIVRGFADEGWLTFGFYPDGNIRLVDVDGARYEGRAISARAQMTEAGGSRSFGLQIGVAPDGRLQAHFSGGAHDGQTLVLESVIERPLA